MIRTIRVPGAGTRLGAVELLPAAPSDRLPVLMIHENRGMVPYMVEVAEALAVAGHRVVAPDLLTRVGGTNAFSHDPTSVSTRMIEEATHEADLLAVFDWMATGSDRLALVGFCFGGEMGWRVITHRAPDVAVLYYGVGPDPVEVANIHSRVYAVYAEDDPRVNDTLPPLCAALADCEAEVVLESFPGTRHAFHDHTRPDRHHPRAAAEVWKRTLEFLHPRASSP